jgi:hypothetical protein
VLALEPARAQDPVRTQDGGAPQHTGVAPGAYESTLRARNRELMNPNEPLKIVGMEQGSNHIRAKAPALDNAIRPPVQVDEKVNYRRTIAMYENGARFYEPLPEATQPGSVSATRAALQAEDNEELNDPTGGDATAHVTSWFLGLGACAALAFVIRKRLGLQF